MLASAHTGPEQLLLILWLVWYLYDSGAIYQSIIPNPFPRPLYPDGNRTAVILTGQFRDGNITILHRSIGGYDKQHGPRTFFGGEDPPTPISTHLEYLLKILGEYGGVDLFMHIFATVQDNSYWNGNPLTYEVMILVKM
jgi:hypothetical protein